MEYLIFSWLVKCFFTLVIICGGVWWINAGCPYYTISRRK